MKRILVLLLAFASSDALADLRRDAGALFEQGIRDLDAGQLDKACGELADSVAMWPDSGARGALAECLTATGKRLEAWRLWQDLATTAPTDDLRSEAAKNAAALLPKLARVRVTLDGTSPAGLRVVVGGVPVTAGDAVPVAPGMIAVIAGAPHHTAWTGSVDAREGAVAEVVVPELAAIARDRGRDRRIAGIAIAAGGGALAGVGLLFGANASSEWDLATAACGATTPKCDRGNLTRASGHLDAANRDATRSTILVSLGVAAVATGAVVYVTGMKRRVHVAPALGPGVAGVAIGGAL